MGSSGRRVGALLVAGALSVAGPGHAQPDTQATQADPATGTRIVAPPDMHDEAPSAAESTPSLPTSEDASLLPPQGTTIAFPYEQKRLLPSQHGNGALAYVPQGIPRGATVPIVVFLHGMNAEGHMHPWFGPPFGDLRKVVDPLVASGAVAPFVLAAPTHIKQAFAARIMWPNFDLDDFVDKTDKALADLVHVDRNHVIVVGHSGAGCNPAGGIFGEASRGATPLAVLAIDTCVDDRVMSRFTSLSERTRLRFYWQSGWRRPVSDLARSCEHCELDEIMDLPLKPNPHLGIVPSVLRRVLPEFLPPP